jgi:flagellar export protein FliJ
MDVAMAPFQFRLETLLRIKLLTRDERRRQLAEAYEAEQIVTWQISELESEMSDWKRQAAEALLGLVDVDRILAFHRHELVLKSREQALNEQRKMLAIESEKRRAALVEADREVRVLEKYRDLRLEQHRIDEARREAKQMDELALGVFLRRDHA